MRIWVALVALTTAFAGCSGDGPEADPVPVEEDTMAPVITAASAVIAPVWQVGDWFGHHVFFGAEDTAGTHINTVVVQDTGDAWLLATDSEEVAKWEAAWDFPMLGAIGKTDLGATAFGAQWGIYEFPMTHGKTWTSSIDPLFEGPRDVSFVATFTETIETPYGVKPGFHIIGTNADGAVEVRTDYVPDIGWYSRLILYQTSTPDPDDYILEIRAMGRGHDWSGTYFVDEARSVVQYEGYLTVFEPQTSSPPEVVQFSLGDTSDELYGIVIEVAVVGTSQALLVDPNGGHHRVEATHLEPDPETGTFTFEFVAVPAVPGDWVFAWGGVGAFTLGVAWLFEITQHEFIL